MSFRIQLLKLKRLFNKSDKLAYQINHNNCMQSNENALPLFSLYQRLRIVLADRLLTASTEGIALALFLSTAYIHVH